MPLTLVLGMLSQKVKELKDILSYTKHSQIGLDYAFGSGI